MTEIELQQLADKKYKEMFNEELNVPVFFSNKLKKTTGRCYWKVENGIKIPRRISIYSNMWEDEILYVLIHELIHVYLIRTQNYPGHGDKFKKLMTKYQTEVHNYEQI